MRCAIKLAASCGRVQRWSETNIDVVACIRYRVKATFEDFMLFLSPVPCKLLSLVKNQEVLSALFSP